MFFTWKRLPLNIQLTIPLIIVQFLAYGLCYYWLVTELEREKFKELAKTLDLQTETIASSLVSDNGRIAFNLNSPIIGEMYRDPNFYFSLTDITGETLAESDGPSEFLQRKLREKISTLRLKDDEIRLVEIDESTWCVFSEYMPISQLTNLPISLDRSAVKAPNISAAANITPMLRDFSNLRKNFSLASAFAILFTSLSIWLIVQRLTSNLRLFAKNLSDLNPQSPVLDKNLAAGSVEEILVFDRFENLLEKIRGASESNRVFVANASHELKTPIAAMMTALQVALLAPRTPEEYQQTCADLLVIVKRLDGLSKALLDLSRLSHADRVEKSYISVGKLFDEITAKWNAFATSRRVELIVNNSDVLKYQLNTDPELLQIAIGNFVQNAIKYSRKDSRVELNAFVEDSKTLCIVIKDSGIGISREDLSRLGEEFFRSDTAREDTSSYGLGFALAKRTVYLLGGKIEVDSIVNQGTTIYLRFA